MSRKYKMLDKDGLYFVSFAVVNWIDIFVRDIYFEVLVDSLNYCQREKGMKLYCYCLMPSHVHLLFRDANSNPSKLLKEFKTFTSKMIRKTIESNPRESRKEWLLRMMQDAGTKNSNVKHYQFWQQNNQPIELWSASVIDQKVNYIHKNPVKAGFVLEDYHWKYSSAIDYAGGKGLVEISCI
ncbi:MAG: transposase [Chitinophagales bacterium]